MSLGNTSNFTGSSYVFGSPKFQIVATGDLNGDSIVDIVGHNLGGQGSLQSLRIVLSTASGGYAMASSPIVSQFISPVVRIGDFTGDRKADIAVYDAGYYDWNARSTIGKEPIMLSGDGNGNFTPTTALLDALKPLVQPVPANGMLGGIQTNLTLGVKDIDAADIDNDGDLDLWIESTGGNNISSHFMINQGGTFTVDLNNRLPESVLFGPKGPEGNYWRYGIGRLHDINGDGKQDLLLGQIRDNHFTHINQSSFVVLNDGIGRFPEANVIRLPLPDFYHGYTAVTGSASGDINGDGLKDLVLIHTRNDDVSGSIAEPAWTGSYVQILVQSAGRHFVDQTSARLGDQSLWSSKALSAGQFAKSVLLQDVNHDGIADIVLSYGFPTPDATRPAILVGTADGRFSPADVSVLTGGDKFFGEGIQGVNLNNDSYLDFIHLDSAPGADGVYDAVPGGDDQSVLVGQHGTRAPVLAMSGTQGNVIVKGTRLDDSLAGMAGKDLLTGSDGNDALDGGLNTDTALFKGRREDYTVTINSTGLLVTDKVADRDGTDSLVNMERLHFADSALALDTSGNAGQAYRLYQAAFNRKPDLGGLGFQINALDTGLSLAQVAQNFINSPEFISTYGSLDNSSFVTQLYANVLHRAPDAGGLEFHVKNLSAGVTRAQTLVGFSESPENQAALIGVIQSGIEYQFAG